MKTDKEKQAMKELRIIPGVGKAVAEDLYLIGIKKVSDLKNADPDKLYAKHNKRVGRIEDRCLLYVFRCAVYFASKKEHHPDLLKWWNWKDKKR
jgi:hypothetical protein